jgi:hypothetical protein
LKLSLDNIAEDLELAMGMCAKAFFWVYTVFVDDTKASPLFVTLVIVAI